MFALHLHCTTPALAGGAREHRAVQGFTFQIIVFVLPTCIGLWGTIIGIAASIIGTIVAILAPFFGR